MLNNISVMSVKRIYNLSSGYHRTTIETIALYTIRCVQTWLDGFEQGSMTTRYLHIDLDGNLYSSINYHRLTIVHYEELLSCNQALSITIELIEFNIIKWPSSCHRAHQVQYREFFRRKSRNSQSQKSLKKYTNTYSYMFG